MNFIVYSKSTGEILRVGKCPLNLISKQLGKNPDPDHAVKEVSGDVNDIDYQVAKNGQVRKRSAEQIIARRDAFKAANTLPPGPRNKLEKILLYLHKQGIDLGPDAEYLTKENPTG